MKEFQEVKSLIGKKVTVRPNRHTGPKRGTLPLTTVHLGRLGKSTADVYSISIKCTGTVVRPAGQKQAYELNNKTVHAGFIGICLGSIKVDISNAVRVEYNPHNGDTFFHINGERYDGGGIITAVGHRYYLTIEKLSTI